MSDIQRVLILGHSGFVGSRLCEQFKERSPGVECVGRSLPEMDMTRQEHTRTLAGLMDRNTALVMLSGIKKQLGDSAEIFEKNLQMVLTLIRVLEEHPVARIVYVSSAAVYGEEVNNTDITEDTPVLPTSYYGIAKYASECLLRKLCRHDGRTTLACVRPPLVYGPGDASKGYGPAGFAKAAVQAQEIVLWGDGSELREFVFVDDLAAILRDLTFCDYDGVLNAASGQSYSFREMLDILASEFNGSLRIRSRKRTKNKADNRFASRNLLHVLPGFRFTGLREGIRRTISARTVDRRSWSDTSTDQ